MITSASSRMMDCADHGAKPESGCLGRCFDTENDRGTREAAPVSTEPKPGGNIQDPSTHDPPPGETSDKTDWRPLRLPHPNNTAGSRSCPFGQAFEIRACVPSPAECAAKLFQSHACRRIAIQLGIAAHRFGNSVILLVKYAGKRTQQIRRQGGPLCIGQLHGLLFQGFDCHFHNSRTFRRACNHGFGRITVPAGAIRPEAAGGMGIDVPGAPPQGGSCAVYSGRLRPSMPMRCQRPAGAARGAWALLWPRAPPPRAHAGGS